MPNTFELIASTTVPTILGAVNLSFTSIPNTYTDLCLVLSMRNLTGGGENASITLNGSSSGFTMKGIYGDGSTNGSYGRSDNLNAVLSDGSFNTANTFSSSQFYFPNYAGSNNKSYGSESLTENNATGATATMQAGLWSNSAAISSIVIAATNGAGTFAQYTTAYLYGVKNA
jgi:hypothetical protein